MEWRLNPRTRRLIDTALEEDTADLDVSSAAFDSDSRSQADLIARDDLVVSGLPVARHVYHVVDSEIDWDSEVEEGTRLETGSRLARLEGPSVRLLQGERTALNLLQRMCGIATKTARYVDALEDDSIAILDTRKTIPGYRELDKYAVRCGGGRNHRYNLSGGIIVKENHIAAAGSIRDAVERIRQTAPPTLKVEVETTSLEEVEAALEANAEIIMLDNMSNDEMREAIHLIRDRAGDWVDIEASGGITRERLPSLSSLDLDYISSGSLTHSVDAADISMIFDDV